MQKRLGFVPDPVHPVEIFSYSECLSLLKAVSRGPGAERHKRADAPESYLDDAREVRRACVGTKQLIVGSYVVARLEAFARTSAQTSDDRLCSPLKSNRS